MTILNKHVMPRWENVRISQVRPMYVQEWLINVDLTATTKGKIKALMHRLFERAMFWELIPTERNPMGLVEIPGSSRRSKKPIVLTVDQYFAILQLLMEPYRTMVVVAQCLGLRVSEILALQWPDISFAELTMRVSRAVVDGIVDEVKTEYSEVTFPSIPILPQCCSIGKTSARNRTSIGFFPARSLDVAITPARFSRTISVLQVESSVWAISVGILSDTPTAPGWTQSGRR
jgi:integrase